MRPPFFFIFYLRPLDPLRVLEDEEELLLLPFLPLDAFPDRLLLLLFGRLTLPELLPVRPLLEPLLTVPLLELLLLFGRLTLPELLPVRPLLEPPLLGATLLLLFGAGGLTLLLEPPLLVPLLVSPLLLPWLMLPEVALGRTVA